MTDFYVEVGDSVRFTKTVGESDIYGFAGITGDFAPVHVDEEYMKRSSYGGRIAHGVLMMGFMSTTSSLLLQKIMRDDWAETAVSLGYDRVRFLNPVRIGDTVRVEYTVSEVDPVRRRSRSDIEVTNQNGEVVAVAQHIMKWVANA